MRIRHNGQPECRASRAYPDVQMRSVSSMTGRRTRRKRIIELSGDPSSIPGFVETLADGNAIVEARPITPLSRSEVFVAVTFDASEWDSIAELLAQLEVHYRTGTTIRAGWERWTLYLTPDDDLSRVIDAVEERGNDVELVRQVNLSDESPDSRFGETVYGLTARQREVLCTAVEVGYYAYDTEATLEDVADASGVGRTTVWEHLARAEEKVMRRVVESLGHAESD